MQKQLWLISSFLHPSVLQNRPDRLCKYIDRVPYFSQPTKLTYSHLIQIWQLFIVLRHPLTFLVTVFTKYCGGEMKEKNLGNLRSSMDSLISGLGVVNTFELKGDFPEFTVWILYGILKKLVTFIYYFLTRKH